MRSLSQASTERITLVIFFVIPAATALGLLRLYRSTKAPGRPPGWGRLLAGNVLLLLFLLSAALLVAEIYYRCFVDTTDSLAFTKLSERWVTRHWHRNSAGCRDNIEYNPVLQPGKRRLTFVGDSFTAGHGIKDVEARFANRLRAAHPDWEIHVLANVGLDTAGEINLLKKAFSRGYQVDEVVLVYCLNDICDLLLAPGGPFEGRMPSLEQMPPWYMRGSFFLDLVYNRCAAARNPYVRNYFAFVKEGYRGPYWQAQKRRLQDFRDLVRAHGGHLSVMVFPFLHALGPEYEYRSAHEELGQFWNQLQAPHLDLLSVYAGRAPGKLTVNRHDAHPNELANQLAAAAIDQVLWPTFTNRPSLGSMPGR